MNDSALGSGTHHGSQWGEEGLRSVTITLKQTLVANLMPYHGTPCKLLGSSAGKWSQTLEGSPISLKKNSSGPLTSFSLENLF